MMTATGTFAASRSVGPTLVAGILIGPTVLGGAISDANLPMEVRPFLSALASVGVAVFMFVVGLKLPTN